MTAPPLDDATVAEIVATIASCGALEECTEFAASLFERAWCQVVPVIEPSFYSIMLRALGWFAVERRH